MENSIQQAFGDAVKAIQSAHDHLAGRVRQAVELIITCYKEEGGVLAFGNGGSAADAQHLVCELVGRFYFDRPALRAEALSTNTSSMTAIGNDYDYETIFERQLRAQGRPGDVAIGLSTSGNSPNVVNALKAAREIGMKTIALTGPGGGACAEFADVLLDVPVDMRSPRLQEAHMVLYHCICQLVEQGLFGRDR